MAMRSTINVIDFRELEVTRCLVAYRTESLSPFNYHLSPQPLKKLSILSTFSSNVLEHGLIVNKNSKFTVVHVVSRYLDSPR